MKVLDLVLELGGEGLIANNPTACYEIGRTQSLLKIKVSIGFLV